MDDSPELHESIRVNPEPRMTATALAEYLILKAEPQATVLHNSRYSQTNIRGAYASARSGFRRYNIDPLRSVATLNKVKDALTRKAADPDVKPRAQAAALREIELIDLFLTRENALGLRSLPLSKAPRFDPLEVAGVSVSIQPDYMVEPPDGRVGAAMLRVTKAPDPDAVRAPSKKEERGDHRREMAHYMVAMMEMALNDRAEYRGRVDRNLIFVSDVRLGEKIGAAADHTARVRDISSACEQIARLWDGVKPRPSIFKKPDDDED
jgi:hypothetical protein